MSGLEGSGLALATYASLLMENNNNKSRKERGLRNKAAPGPWFGMQLVSKAATSTRRRTLLVCTGK